MQAAQHPGRTCCVDRKHCTEGDRKENERRCGKAGSVIRGAGGCRTLVDCWYVGSRTNKIAISWGSDGIFVHLEKQDVLCGFAE